MSHDEEIQAAVAERNAEMQHKSPSESTPDASGFVAQYEREMVEQRAQPSPESGFIRYMDADGALKARCGDGTIVSLESVVSQRQTEGFSAEARVQDAFDVRLHPGDGGGASIPPRRSTMLRRPLNDAAEAMHKRINHDFRYHPPRPEQVPVYAEINERCAELAHRLVDVCPSSRELSLALTELEGVRMWANAAVARNG